MKTSTVFGVVAVLCSIGGGVALGMWIKSPTIDDLVKRNRELSALDTLKTVQLDSARVAYSVLVDDFRNEKELREFAEDSLSKMSGVTSALLDKVENQGNEITHLTQANARLEERLSGSLDGITAGDTVTSAELHISKSYQDGSINADGYVTIFTPSDNEPYGNTSLYFDIKMNPSVVVSRDEAGLATCDLSFGDMPIYLTDLVCVDNLGYDAPVRKDINWPAIGIGAGIVAGVVFLVSLIL